ncbi:MAG: molybdopterin-dependent oxidoreductase [Firmicutes bacterium]|nr:molybdopterin-dependent oxidoreductase [Bacillota bacterium]
MSEVKKLTSCTTGGPVRVHVQDDKILRITPLELDDTDAPSWEIEARGKKFSPPRKATISSYTAGQKSVIYSDNRVMYPMKRVDFDPNGERNCQNRGVSGYERISWDEALDIVSGEMKRIKRDFGPAGVAFWTSSHQLWGNFGYRFSALARFQNLVGFTEVDHNPDSWEGWHWGATHLWGFSWRMGLPEQYDLLEDALQNTEMIVFWASDPETTSGLYAAHESTPRRFWLKELGVEMVFIDPFYNNTASLHSDKWMAPRMGTDSALALGIAYTWITEDTYDHDYIERLTTGFDKWKAYVLGETDGVPKTCEWAESECGIPAREIRALARKWAKKKTMLAVGGLGGWGGACRAAGASEWTRMMVILAVMQGCGKPGSNIWSTQQGAPCNCEFMFPGYSEGGIAGSGAAGFRWNYRLFDEKSRPTQMPQLQTIKRLNLPEAILEGHAEWYANGFATDYIEQQFQKVEYPMPGMPRIQMLYRFGASSIGTMTETNRYARMYRSENLPFVVCQNPWFEGEAQFADIILPACTNYERNDISEFAAAQGYLADSVSQNNHRIIVMQKKCIEPLGESKPDYEIFVELSKRLGIDDAYTEGGKTEMDWIKQYFHATDLPKYVTWEEFYEKGYFVVPVDPNRKRTPALRWFYEERERDTPDWGPAPRFTVGMKGLQTASGKVEFEASSLKRFDPDDPERHPVPQYDPSWEGHHTKELYDKYPLQMVSPHPRYSFHTMGDGKDSFMNDIKDHRVLIDGWYYWVARLNSKDAEARGIKEHDLIRMYNDRGSVIVAAEVTNRVPPGCVHSYESSAVYAPIGEPGNSPDRGGCVNILAPKRNIIKKSSGMANNSCLIQVEKWEGGNK